MNYQTHRKLQEVGLILLVAVGAILLADTLTNCTACDAEASMEPETVTAIRLLQPRHDARMAQKLAEAFDAAGQEAGIDPLLLVAISSRESSLLPGVVGSLGERGLLQVHGVALSARPENCSHLLESVGCQVRTGARWLAWARRTCPGSTARWVSAYGRSRCPSEAVASREPGVLLVRERYERIGGDAWVE